MKHGSIGRRALIGAGLSVLLVAGACTEAGPTASDTQPILNAAFAFISGANADPVAAFKSAATANSELFEVCKRWVGATAVANFEVTNGVSAPSSFSTDDGTFYGPFSYGGHDDWSCRDVWLDGNLGATITVTETSVTGGSNPYSTVIAYEELNNSQVVVDQANRTISALIRGTNPQGVVAFFTNTEEVPGNQGCTPGYWKQSQHFGNWTTYGQGDSYDATFGVASSFGGTLLDALNRGGGGQNALGRHAVAALLNAASGGVNSVYTTAQVIAMVQGAYASGDFNGVKDVLAAANELGCPLGRNP